MMESKRVLIAGYYGFGNTGDEAILSSILQNIRVLQPDIQVIVISGNPPQTEAYHRVKAIHWNDIQKITRSVNICNIVILGGGGLFHDYWGFDPSSILTSKHSGISFYSSIALLAGIFKKPLILYGVGVGPLLSKLGKTITKAIVEQSCLVLTRDKESKELLISLGINPKDIIVTTDPAFQLKYEIEKTKNIPIIKHDHGPILGVALRNWDVGVLPAYWERQVAETLDNFLDIHQGIVVFIPFQEGQDAFLNDVNVALRIQNQMNHSKSSQVLRNLTPKIIHGLLAECDLVLGMRLHALIFAIKNLVPAVGLIYDPKVNNVMSQAGLEAYTMDIKQLTSHSLTRLLEKAYSNRTNIKGQLQSKSVELKKKAHKNALRMINVLKISDSVQPPLSSENLELLKQVVMTLSQSYHNALLKDEKLTSQITSQQSDFQSQLNELHAQIKNLESELLTQKDVFDQTYSNLISEHEQLIFQRDQNIAYLHDKIKDMEQEHCQRIKELQIKLDIQNQNIQKMSNELTASEGRYQKVLTLLNQLDLQKHKQQALLNAQLIDKQQNIQFLKSQLEDIKGSRGWKILWALWEIRLYIIPRGSRREFILKKVLNVWRKNSPSKIVSKVFMYSIGKRFLMSRYAFAFDQFKRSRNQVFPPDLSGLCFPSQKGLVSIVLPVYNGAAFVSEAIESILNQTYTKFELILIDDGSQDLSREILDQYAETDNRIQVIHQENQKLPLALSRGFQVVKGEFLTWTSHDNRLKPDFLEKMVGCLQRHPTWDMVYGNMDIIGENGAALKGADWFLGYQYPPGSEHIYLPKDTAELNTWPNNFIGGAFLYRDRVKWLIGDYSPSQFTREDYDYWMRINSLLTLRHADFNNPVYEYRFHSDSLTAHDEQLGITRNRKKLMVFDDFRRDFYLSPLIWIIDEEISNDFDRKKTMIIRKMISDAGHIIVDSKQLSGQQYPSLWLPIVYLKIISNPAEIGLPLRNVPDYAINALLSLSHINLPENISGKWDICFALGNKKKPLKVHGGCQGWIVSNSIQPIFTGLDIFIRTQNIKRIESELRIQKLYPYRISVVICTYKRGHKVKDALRAVAFQTMPLSDYEVIVVNNNPEDTLIDELVQDLQTQEFKNYPDHLRLLQCPLLGLSHARNMGISAAQSEAILFLDDDAIADENILEEYWKAFQEHPETGVIGGHIILQAPAEKSIPWKAGWERYWSQFTTPYSDYTPVTNWWEFPWGANWAARRKALVEIGGFRQKYGRKGNDFSGGEEIVAASQIQQLGYSIAILPQAKVDHRVDPRRFTSYHLKKTIRAGMLTHYQAQIELQLPFESTIGQSIKLVRNTLLNTLIALFQSNSLERNAAILESYYYLSARWKLICQQILDNFKRVRRPITFFKEI